jgi:hypothetical protein
MVLYVTSAALSGHLSPFARRPLLDGLAPLTPYRWVNPPPNLRRSNKEPVGGRFSLELGGRGSIGNVFTTGDGQVTVIFPDRAIGAAAGQRSIEVTIEPVDPGTLAALTSPLTIIGNAVQIRARYQPSGRALDEASRPVEVVLTYPFLLHDTGRHSVVASASGKRWRAVKTKDHFAAGQAVASITRFGFVAVATTARSPGPPSSVPGPAGEGIPIVIIVVAGALLVLLIIAVVGGRRRDRGRHGPRS